MFGVGGIAGPAAASELIMEAVKLASSCTAAHPLSTEQSITTHILQAQQQPSNTLFGAHHQKARMVAVAWS